MHRERSRLAARLAALLALLPLLAGGVAAAAAPLPGPMLTGVVTNLSQYPDGELPRLEKFEVTLTLDRSYQNPFDPDEIRVEGIFTTPWGEVLVQPGFYFQEYQLTTVAGVESTTPIGSPVWKVRFTPREAGVYGYRIRVSDRDGSVESAPASLPVRSAAGSGFVSVSKRNSRYFEHDDGTPFIGLGLNVGWWQSDARRVSTYEYYFTRMSEVGANLARVWMVNSGRDQRWILSLQDRVLGAEYNLEEAWAFDAIVELAHQRGVVLLLTLDDVNQYSYNWPDNLYNRALGGPCGTRSEIFTNPQARIYQQRVFRYIVARWGHTPNLLAWELFNEIDELQWSDPSHWNRQAMIDWHQAMARYIRSIDAHSHLVNTSTGSFTTHPDLYGLAEIGFAEIHFYFVAGCCSYATSDPAGHDMADLTRYYAELVSGSVAAKPSLVGEWGLLDEGWGPSPYLERDDRGVHLHNGMWASLMSGLAATGLSWHWESHRRNDPAWWLHYRALSGFFAGMELSDLRVLRPVNVDLPPAGGTDPRPPAFVASNPALRVLGLRGGERVYAWIQNRGSTWWRYVHGDLPEPQSGTVAITGLTPSQSYTVEWWDTYRGGVSSRQLVTAQGDGSIVLEVERLETDVAIKVFPTLPNAPRPPRPLLRRP